jgi:hypothetical protein
MFSFTPTKGKVCLNQGMPEEIRNRLKKDPSYLEVLRAYQDADFSPSNRRFWCFPQYKRRQRGNNMSKTHDESISTISERSSATSGGNAGNENDLERSITPSRGTESVIDSETIEDYLKFPDP